MNILLVGSGAREHALAWKISKSPLLRRLYIAPGNPGTEKLGKNIQLDINDFQQIKLAVLRNNISMVIVGPEDPLVNGLHDFFLADEDIKNIPVIGPSKVGAQLEGSKAFSKGFMKRHGIPTAKYQTFDENQKKEALEFLKTMQSPYVLKADGLAAGKGVIICDSLKEAEKSLNSFFKGAFGKAGKTVVIEEFLDGIEVSAFVLTDGQSYVMLPEAKDYKRAGDGDTGPNTGGMGAVSPVPFYDENFRFKVEEQVIKPTIHGIQKEELVYTGFIFIGLMNVNGKPYVIEYNVRMGDPETQVVMPRLKSDLLELFALIPNKQLNQAKVEFNNHTATAVVLASNGYPGTYSKGFSISLPKQKETSIIFQAGTRKNPKGSLHTSGGRVMAAVGLGKNIQESVDCAYKLAEGISFDGKYYRTDIGKDLIHL